MLDELVSCIETLQDRIKAHGESLRENEIRTRIQLIDPLLRALGWDVSDPSLVVPEYKVKDDRADYALLQPGDGLVAFIEAKRLNTVLDPHQSQMVKYALMDGIKHVGLTDGNRWEFYDLLRPVGMDEKQILGLSIADTPSHECALRLLILWRSNLSTGEPVPAASPVLSATVDPPPVRPSPDDKWVSLSEYNPPPNTPPPKSIRFWDGKEHPIKYWNEVLVSTAEKLYVEGTLKAADTPIHLWSDAWYHIHSEPVSPDGTEWRKPLKQIGDPPLFVNVNLSGADLRSGTILLLKKYDVDPVEVYLLPRE